MRKYRMDESSAYMATLADSAKLSMTKALLLDMVRHMERAGMAVGEAVAKHLAAVREEAMISIHGAIDHAEADDLISSKQANAMRKAEEEARAVTAENVWWQALRKTETQEGEDSDNRT